MGDRPRVISGAEIFQALILEVTYHFSLCPVSHIDEPRWDIGFNSWAPLPGDGCDGAEYLRNCYSCRARAAGGQWVVPLNLDWTKKRGDRRSVEIGNGSWGEQGGINCFPWKSQVWASVLLWYSEIGSWLRSAQSDVTWVPEAIINVMTQTLSISSQVLIKSLILVKYL